MLQMAASDGQVFYWWFLLKYWEASCKNEVAISWPRFFSRFGQKIQPLEYQKKSPYDIFNISVGDPWHFGVDPDPDPRIRTSD